MNRKGKAIYKPLDEAIAFHNKDISDIIKVISCIEGKYIDKRYGGKYIGGYSLPTYYVKEVDTAKSKAIVHPIKHKVLNKRNEGDYGNAKEVTRFAYEVDTTVTKEIKITMSHHSIKFGTCRISQWSMKDTLPEEADVTTYERYYD